MAFYSKFSNAKMLIGVLGLVVATLLVFNLKNNSKILAQEGSIASGCNINMPDWSEQKVQDCIQGGGTIAFVGTDGDFGSYIGRTWEIINAHNESHPDKKVVPEFRLYKDDSPPSEQEIKSFVATVMEGNNSGDQVMFRLMNEVTDGYAWPGMDDEAVANAAAEVYVHLTDVINESGANALIVSEMLDLWNGQDPVAYWESVNAKILSLTGGEYGYYDTIDIYAINGYFNPDDFGQMGTNDLNSILSTLQSKAPGKAWRFSEFGYKPSDGNPSYDDTAKIAQTIIALNNWLNDSSDNGGASFAGTFTGFNIFASDPHKSSQDVVAAILERAREDPTLRGALSDLANLTMENMQRMFPGSFNKEQYDEWIQKMIDEGIMVECKDPATGEVIGFAPTLSQCRVDFAMPGENMSEFQCTVYPGRTPDSGEFRPEPCQNCSLNVPKPVDSCAVSSSIEKKSQIITCENSPFGEGCNSRVYHETWGVDFILDTRETTVPFADYRETRLEETKVGTRTRSQNDYLNSYFAGTALYDGRMYNPDLDEYATQTEISPTAYSWEAGVVRKLTSWEEQNKLRGKLIADGYDYQIEQSNMNTSMWKVDMDPYPNGYFPPDPNDPGVPNGVDPELYYLQNLEKWRKTNWGKYWEYIPLFSSEDAPGKAILRVQSDPGKLSPLNAGRKKGDDIVEIPLSIPHLTRLYQSTEQLFKIMTPSEKQQEYKDQAYLRRQGKMYAKTNELNKPKAESTNLCTDASAVITSSRLVAQANTESDVVITGHKILAQADGGEAAGEDPCAGTGIKIDIEDKGDSYAIKLWNTRSTSECVDMSHFGLKVDYYVDGVRVGGCDQYGGDSGGAAIPNWPPDLNSDNPTVKWGWDINSTYGGACNPPSKEVVGDGTLAVEVAVRSDVIVPKDGGSRDSCPKTSQCRTDQKVQTPPIEPTPTCGPAGDPAAKCEKDAIEDQNPNDEVCCSSGVKVTVPDWPYKFSEEENRMCEECVDQDEDGECDEVGMTKTMKRDIENKLEVPYLDEIWEMTSSEEYGFFQSFNPDVGTEKMYDFSDKDAKSTIHYQLTNWSSSTPVGKVNPNNGDFYWPKLGGIHWNKKCVSEQILTPKQLQINADLCNFESASGPPVESN